MSAKNRPLVAAKAHRRSGPPWWRSLRWRLALVFMALAVLSAGLFMASSQRLLERGFQTVVVPLLRDYVDRLSAELGTPPDPVRAQALVERLPIQIHIDGPQVRWSSDGREPRDEALAARRHRALDALISRQTADGHTLTFGVDRERWARERLPPVIWRPILVLLALTGLTYLLLRRLFRPLDDVRAGAQRFGQGDFGTPIAVRRGDELGALAQDVNAMAHSLDGMLQAQRSVLLAISHELRSPLTRARLQAELLPEGPEQAALVRELGAMNQLIQDLLDSERLAAVAPQLQLMDLNAVLRQAVAEVAADEGWSAAQLGALRWQLAEGLPPVAVDAQRLKLLLRNLLQNAWRHGQAQEKGLNLCTGIDGQAVFVALRDHGPGVPEAALKSLGEPFFRPDAARSRSDGGVGLGLYLCRRVAQSMGLALQLEGASPGLRVTLRWGGAVG